MGLKSWTTREMMITAVIGIVLGVLSTIVDYIYSAGGAALGPAVTRTLIGIVMFTALFVPYVIRKPGAALIGMIIIGFAQIPFSPGGVFSLVISAIYGLFVEAAFFMTRYKRYSFTMLAITACVVGGIGLGLGYVANGLHELELSAQLFIWIATLGSCVVGAYLVILLADALKRSGLILLNMDDVDEDIVPVGHGDSA